MKRFKTLGALLVIVLAVGFIWYAFTHGYKSYPTDTALSGDLKVQEDTAFAKFANTGFGIDRFGLPLGVVAPKLTMPGPSKIVVLPAYFNDQTINLLPPQATIQATFDAAAKIWNDAAGQTIFTTDLAAPFIIPHPSTITGCPVDWLSTAAITAANAGHNGAKSAYFSTLGGGCPYGGDAARGGSTLFLYILNSQAIAHEEGHMLLLDHALSVIFDGAFGDFAHVRYGAYSDIDSVMAGGTYVTGYDLWLLGWFRPPEVLRGATTVRVTITPGARGGVFIRRADGIIWYLEMPSAGQPVRLRTSSVGTPSFGPSGFGGGDYSYWNKLAAGQDLRDEYGGVEFKMIDATTIDLSSFPPTALQPTPNPNAVPTPTPYIGPQPTRGPAPCFIGGIIPCTPTPGGASTPTPTPTLTRAAVTTTPTPTVAVCVTTATGLCLNSRFMVSVAFIANGSSGVGTAVALTSDTGYFWFFNANAAEVMVKIIDGRAVNNSYWVFAGGLTNVDVTITVTDTVTHAVKTYRNPQGTAFQPIQDTSAFSVPGGRRK